MTLPFIRRLAALVFAAALPLPLLAAPFAYVPNEGSGTISVIDTAKEESNAGSASDGSCDHFVHDCASQLSVLREGDEFYSSFIFRTIEMRDSHVYPR